MGDRRDRVLNRDDLMILRPDVPGEKARRLMEWMSVIGGRPLQRRPSSFTSQRIDMFEDVIDRAARSASDLAMAGQFDAPLKSCG